MKLLKIKRRKTRKLPESNLQIGGNTDNPGSRTIFSVAGIGMIKEN
tara:strand:- start:1734 stop:1871 length:138 start_codon:yes stop_codon:yes gene_type:complete